MFGEGWYQNEREKICVHMNSSMKIAIKKSDIMSQ